MAIGRLSLGKFSFSSTFIFKRLLLFLLLIKKNIHGINADRNDTIRMDNANNDVTEMNRFMIAVCEVSGSALFFISQVAAQSKATIKSTKRTLNGIK